MVVRIVSWNLENASDRVLAALPEVVAQWGAPEVVCLQELRIRRHDAHAIARLAHALPGYRCHVSLPRDARNVTFRGGRMYGVATFVHGRWTGEAPEWDLEGRVVVARKPGLAIVNVYAVNGTAKPYLDAEGRVAGDRHAYKRRFQAQVMDLGRDLRDAGGVVLAGDWNVSLTARDTHPRLRTEAPHARARAELAAGIDDAGFVDVWRARHPDARAYTWFNRRARGLDAARVDYVLVSQELVPAVRAADILELLPWSDHAPVRVDLGPAARPRKASASASGA